MRLRTRFLLDVFAPPLIAALLFMIAICVDERSLRPLAILPFVVFMAYTFAVLPSVVHALFMRSRYLRGTPPGGGRALLLSTLSGLAAGAMIALVITGTSGGPEAFLVLLPMGAFTGAINAGLQRLLPIRRKA